MVGSARVELFLPACRNLKDKRAIVKSAVSRLRQRFNVSVAEVDYLEQWQRSILAIAAVANDLSFLRRELDAAVRLVESTPGVELVRVAVDFYD